MRQMMHQRKKRVNWWKWLFLLSKLTGLRRRRTKPRVKVVYVTRPQPVRQAIPDDNSTRQAQSFLRSISELGIARHDPDHSVTVWYHGRDITQQVANAFNLPLYQGRLHIDAIALATAIRNEIPWLEIEFGYIM